MTDIKKAQFIKIVQLGGFIGAILGKLAVPLMKVSVPLAKTYLVLLATMASAFAIGSAIQRKMRGQVLVRGRKGNPLVT